MLATRRSRIVLVVSIVAGVVCVFAIPPYLYFQFARFAAGLPQQYLAFDPDRYLAGAPQRSAFAVACITAAKFAFGAGIVWLCYGVAQFVRRGRPANPRSTS
jgi:apolipoprotein N-acyltransferase